MYRIVAIQPATLQ